MPEWYQLIHYKRRIPSVLAKDEVDSVLAHMNGQELLGHSDASITIICTHVLRAAAGDTSNPLDSLTSLHVLMSALAAVQPVYNKFGKR